MMLNDKRNERKKRMKLAFLFSTPFLEFEGRFYSVNLTKEFWENRYLKYFDQVIVVGRKKHVDEDPSFNMSRSDSEKVSFVCIDDQPPIKRLLSIFETKKFIKNAISDCDAVICRNWWGTGVCRKLRKPYMIEVITNVWDSLWYHSKMGKIAAIPNYIIQRIAVWKAPFVLYVSRFFLQDDYPTRGRECGCPDVWLEPPTELVLEKRIGKINNLKDGSITLGLIGANSVGYRGHDTLLETVSKLRNSGVDCRAKFLGGGDSSRWEKYAQKLGISEYVEFDRPIPHGVGVLEWIDSIDIMVMPTKAESLGRAVIEAMSRGCPVLGTVETGIREQIGSDCLFKAGDIDTVCRMVKHMMEDKAYMKYCALENYYRSFKYANQETDKTRNAFMEEFVDYIKKVNSDRGQ